MPFILASAAWWLLASHRLPFTSLTAKATLPVPSRPSRTDSSRGGLFSHGIHLEGPALPSHSTLTHSETRSVSPPLSMNKLLSINQKWFTCGWPSCGGGCGLSCPDPCLCPKNEISTWTWTSIGSWSGICSTSILASADSKKNDWSSRRMKSHNTRNPTD